MDRPLVPSSWRRSSLRLGNGMIPIALIGMVISFTGCAHSPTMRSTFATYDLTNCRCVSEMKARLAARGIWRDKYAHCYGNRANSNDVKQGFIDGYVDRATGGTGCPPIIAPARYGGLACLTHAKPVAHAWFEGFPLGVVAAETCGAIEDGRSSINPAFLACFKDDACHPGCRPCVQSTCGCGSASCSGGCGSVNTFGGIQNGMQDGDGAVIIEHSTNPVPVPNTSLPAPSGLPIENAPPVPQPIDTSAAESDVPSGNMPLDANGPVVERESVVLSSFEMPDMQLRFDFDETRWMFGDVDLARSILQLDPAVDHETTSTSL